MSFTVQHYLFLAVTHNAFRHQGCAHQLYRWQVSYKETEKSRTWLSGYLGGAYTQIPFLGL